MINAFDTEVALDVGIIAAVLYKNIQYWCEKNRANEMNEHDGLFWTYNSMKAYQELFPYMGTKAIRAGLDKLVEKGYIKVGNFNEDGRDRTRWYADIHPSSNIEPDEKSKSNMPKGQVQEDETEDCNMPKGQMRDAKRANAECQKGKPLPDNYQITTQITNTNKKERKKEAEESARGSFDQILDSAEIVRNNPGLREAFGYFIKMRTRIKAPLTDRGLQLAINRAYSIAHGDPKKMEEVVNQSIERSWRGIFDITDEKIEPKMNGSPAPGNPFRKGA